ncbi:aryl-alcohol dehydrogenase-like predicted oxidoreductase [Palleronia aestuarii]|uniref:Aryl-alcohol dehydrogenase-like predicted oxidoreductase n=1 Tax=Palleronia aestuarii TaxID=568105 RepID=A0A2W7NY66_9RHOB|nr:aldo/keto reductase [Palleronia aestuarii]PZX18216.1 aryl-alcohol dehydrogenase-like predicted oxidoreductase [Palleronia aestuarii]
MQMTHYRPFGRSGLIVSPMALGTMTFGAGRWGADEPASREILDTYVEAGGNLIDTADVYSAGESEKMLGRFLKDSGLRDRLVISTKSGFPRSQGTPLHGGNGAYNIRLGIEGSLKRLGVDRIDLYWVHVWDQLTPAEEVLRTLADATSRGEILYYGFSNTPSWYVARVATLAAAQGLPGPIGLQYAWSLVERGVELDIVPMARAFGLGMMPWSPLGGGLLTGKYGREKLSAASQEVVVPTAADADTDQPRERLSGANPYGGMLFTERNFDIVDIVREIAAEHDVSLVQVALAWLLSRRATTAVLLGASKAAQLRSNIEAMSLRLTDAQIARLDAASAPPSLNPYSIFDLPREMLFGGVKVE